MTKKEFSEALKIAIDRDAPLVFVEDTSAFDGCYLRGFKPIVATIRQAAAVIRWHCVMLNGNIDSAELQEMNRVFRHKVSVI